MTRDPGPQPVAGSEPGRIEVNRKPVWGKRTKRNALSGLLMKAGLDYGRLGWSVIPIEPRGKRSLLRWQVYQRRRPEATEIAEWFERWPDANIAVVTGVVSRIVALDIDSRRGADAGLAALEAEHATIPETVEVRTGAGGSHLYFVHPGGLLHSRIGLAPGVDLHADGGYLVAPPSIHETGESYCWVRSPEVCPPATLPDWLVEAGQAPTPRRPEVPQAQWRGLLRDGAEGDDRGARIAALAEYLNARGLDPQLTAELLLAWNDARCRPPLEPRELTGVLASVSGALAPEDDDGGQ